jgi:hypothetical protein
VLDGALELGRTGQPAGAEGHRAVPLDRAVTDRAGVGEVDGGGPVVGLEHLDHLRDDVARALDAHAVADVDAEALDLRWVVQRRPRDRHAADVDGVEQPDGREPAGPAHLHDDVPDGRLLGPRGELVGEGPPRRPRGRPEDVPRRAVVDRDDGAVDLVVQFVPLRQDGVPVVDRGLDVVDQLGAIGDPQPPGRQPFVEARERLELAARLEHLEEVRRERPLGDDRGVELAEGPRGRVARVGEGLLAGLDPLSVVSLERVARHVDLAPEREGVGVVAAEPHRHGRDGLDLGADVVARLAVAPGDGAVELAVLVDELDREAVELGLTEVSSLAVPAGVVEGPPNPLVELADVGGVAATVDREHRPDVLDGLELVDGCPADPPRRAVLGRQAERVLEGLQALEEGVVRAVRDGGIRLDVVVVVVVADGLAELLGLGPGRVRGEGRDRLEVRVGVLDVRVVRRRGLAWRHRGRPRPRGT